MCKIVILTVACLALVCGQALAQDVPATPQNCSDIATSMNWNNTAIFTRWKEVARHPAGKTNACMEFSVTLLSDNTTLSFNTSHSSSPTSLYANVNEPTVNVTLVQGATTGYNVSFSANSHVFIKLLQLTNSNNYLSGCGYTNATDPTTGFGFVLGRESTTNATGLQAANNAAALVCKDFSNNNYTTILQDGCYMSSASQSLPLLTGFLTLALLLIKAY